MFKCLFVGHSPGEVLGECLISRQYYSTNLPDQLIKCDVVCRRCSVKFIHKEKISLVVSEYIRQEHKRARKECDDHVEDQLRESRAMVDKLQAEKIQASLETKRR